MIHLSVQMILVLWVIAKYDQSLTYAFFPYKFQWNSWGFITKVFFLRHIENSQDFKLKSFNISLKKI